MRYLISVPAVNVAGRDPDTQLAPGGEPVIPWFPAPVANMFLALPSFKKAAFAVVADVDVDPDIIADMLCKQYPGLPRQLHENYVMATALAANMLNVGDRVRAILTADTAQIQVADTPVVLELWDEQPIKGKICAPTRMTL